MPLDPRPFLQQAQEKLAYLGELGLEERRAELSRSIPNLPDRLYHYRGYSTSLDTLSLRQILVDSKLYLRAPTDFNDPFDCQFHFGGLGDLTTLCDRLVRRAIGVGYSLRVAKREVRAATTPERISTTNTDAERITRETLESTGIFCFSDTFKNILMWSHYADKHTGICIEFDTAIAYNVLPIARAVTYGDQMPTLIYPERDKRMVIAPIFSKAAHWAYEREWRLAIAGQCHQFLEFPAQSVTSIIYGCRASEATRATLREILDERARAGFPGVVEKTLTREQREYGLIEAVGADSIEPAVDSR